ncbi:polysaccharide deacetylase family protein [Catenovulum sp. SM1970]|uniref:cellulose-binding domain-containing protein n=1 Tax=Marinifaba aquimaris TaxID=2741323 RepID=UPI001573D83A|nr:cellulose-binding domain-containing protein [Marinifaba aquimaris]NTS76653.1 polysaccharide deacetylase family protein [Marinifaba aquimaris]
MTHISKIAAAVALATCATSSAFAAQCSDFNYYPDFPQLTWDGQPSHADKGDQLVHNGIIWQANWWTNSEPSAEDNSWSNVGLMSCIDKPIDPNSTVLDDGKEWIGYKYTSSDVNGIYSFSPALMKDRFFPICTVKDYYSNFNAPECADIADTMEWQPEDDVSLMLTYSVSDCYFDSFSASMSYVDEDGFVGLVATCLDWVKYDYDFVPLPEVAELNDVMFETEIPQVSIATWRNDAPAAYAMQHDDWCGGIAPGILEHVYPEVSERGLTTSIGVVAGSCTEQEWQQAKDFVDAGFSIFNHSMTHAFNDAPPWDQNLTTNWNDQEQIHQSNMAIADNTGYVPSMFGIPYGIWRSESDHYMQKYLGISSLRAPSFVDGQFSQSHGINAADFADNYRILGNLYDDDWSPYNQAHDGAAKITSYLDDTIASGGFGLQYFHGVNDGSYHSVPLADYQTFLDYLKTKVDNGEVWLDTPENIIKYRNLRDECQAEVKAIPYGYLIEFNTGINNCHAGSLPVTLKMDIDKKVKHVSGSLGSSFEQVGKTLSITTAIDDPIIVVLTNLPVEPVNTCNEPAYQSGQTYNYGDKVSYQAQIWQAKWTVDVAPSDQHWGAWVKVEDCN